MWTVKTVGAKNFMSFGDVAYNFENGCTIIKAENNDDEGQESNGGGKTSFIDILPICLLGQSLTGRNLKDCVNWRTEDKFFTVSCELVHSDGRNATISRKVFNNTKSAELYVTVDGEAPKGVPKKDDKLDVNPGNTWILEELLDISKEDLLGYYLISPNYYTPYFKASAKNKVEIINRFSKANKIDQVIVDLEQVKSSKLMLYEGLDLQLNGLEDQEIRLGDALQTPFQSEDTMDDAQVATIVSELDLVKKQIEEYDHQMLHFDTNELDKAIEAEKKIELSARGVVTNVNDCNGMINGLKSKLAGTLNCPNCSFEFMPSADEDVKGLKESLDELNLINVDLQKDYDASKAEVLNIREHVKAVRDQVNNLRQKIMAERDALKPKLSQLTQEYSKVEAYKRKVAEHNGIIAGYQAQLESVKVQMDNIKIDKDNKKIEVEAETEWIKNFNDFKFYLANKPIKIISGQINNYLKANQSDMMVHIEGFKMLKTGKVKQQLNPIIYRNSEKGFTYDTFSGGERVKLNISADLAFQELINSSSKSGGLNYYCNDELLNSLDSLGIGLAAQAFDGIDKTIMLVSHSGADLHHKKIVNIVKENGESTIK